MVSPGSACFGVRGNKQNPARVLESVSCGSSPPGETVLNADDHCLDDLPDDLRGIPGLTLPTPAPPPPPAHLDPPSRGGRGGLTRPRTFTAPARREETMSDFLISLLILALIACLIVTVAGFALYSGLLHEVVIRTGSPPIRSVTIAYKFREGSYKDCGAAFTESCSIGPKLRSIGVYYDDPKQRPPEKCRYVVGSILSEGEEKPDEELQRLYEKFGFKVFSLPEVTHAVTTTFPCTTPLSYVLGPTKVYPSLSAYIEERKLCAFPTIEICNEDLTHYMMPLSRQTDFFVQEMRDEVKTDVKEEDSDEDRGTDITGADSHSDVSSVSSGVPWDSRETSLAASTAASLASSLPLRDLADGEEEHAQQRAPSEAGSNKSLGSSSSFEELDMVQEEGKEVEEEEEEEAVDGKEEEEEEGLEAEDKASEPTELAAEKMEPLGVGEE
ncbi:testis-expressed protein 264 homolog [Lampris incognitus]|uniref:testis-expressed protein 264 homolog n=1 Tax=Lampris incognitus TaxID=2546036 RepID=UPI0024B4EA23|nr:testis-expressed protein 264 homolog [Lampris incognitus]